jgi:rod shape determining protein RodA
MDGTLFALILAALTLSLFVQFSASGQSIDRVLTHAINMVVALSVMWMVAQLPPQKLMRFALPAYMVGLLLLIGVAVSGEVVNGARRWLNLGITRIQPSEIMKIAVPLMIASFLDKRETELTARTFGFAAILLVLPVALIVRQPDLGTALLITASGFFVLLLGGLSWKIIIGLLAAGATSLPFVWKHMHDYQRERVLTLLDPSTDPLGAGYHIIQSTIAVGSGGVVGKGWLRGTQSHLDFLPERTTDFLFAVYSEEFGFVGDLLLLVLYTAIVVRGLMIAISAPTLFTRLMAGSITFTLATYAFVNMGMVSGIMPVVGVPLPLMSYGGTSMVTMLLGFGILMSIATHKRLVKS